MVLETEEGIETTILDLGLAKFRHLHSVSITQTGAAIGTAEYMSPEQGKGLWVDHRSDLYSLGIILYEMLTGTPPFSGQNPISVIMKHIRESPPPIGEADVEVPEQTQQIVLKLLAKEPVDRYQSAEEVVQALNSVASSRFVLPDDKQRDVHRKVMRSQFIGRESEMKKLRAMLQDVQAGKQRVVLISGEAGVGKSRLVEELLGDALIHDFLCLKGAGREEGGQIYGALIDAFRQGKTTDLVAELPAPLREVNRRADVWKMMPIAHFDIQAGENYRYTLRTETAGLLPARALLGWVQIPGALLENIQFLPEEGTATVNWHLSAGVPRRYELLRSVDDAAAQVIFQSEDPEVASFTDVLIEGNRKYTYRLRNTMDRDVVLDSREMFIYPYQRRLNFNIVEASNAFVALTPAAAFVSPVLALLATSDAISIREANPPEYVYGTRVLPVPNRAGLRLESLSVATMATGLRAIVLLGGILAETGEVQLSAFQEMQLGPSQWRISKIPWRYEDWRVADSELPTAMTVAPDGTIWAGVGRRLKAFSFETNNIVERGSYDTGTEGAIQSLAVLGPEIWIVTTLGEVFRTDTSHMGSQPVWEEVVLPAGVFPVWVGSGPRAAFVLARDRVMVFNADGQPVLWWRVLDDLVLDPAGLAVSKYGGVYVWDAQNRVVLFVSAPPFLVPFVQADPN